MKVVDVKPPDYEIRCKCCNWSSLIGYPDCPVMQMRLLTAVIGRMTGAVYILKRLMREWQDTT